MSLDIDTNNNSEAVNKSTEDLKPVQLDQDHNNQTKNITINKLTTKSARLQSSQVTAPAKKRIKLEKLNQDSPSSFTSSASFTPSPSPKDDDRLQSNLNELNNDQMKDNSVKENLNKNNLNEFNKTKINLKLNRPETPPSAELIKNDLANLSNLPNLLTSNHLAPNNLSNLSNLSQFSSTNPLINQNLLTTLQTQQQQQQHHLNSLAQLYSTGNAAHLLSPNSMKTLKFSIDNILQQKPDQLKNGSKLLQETVNSANGLQLSKLHLQLQQHHLQLQKQHMQFKQQLNQATVQQSNQNQSKVILDDNNDSNDSTSFNSSAINNSSMIEESKSSNLTSIWPGWAYCRSYADPTSGIFVFFFVILNFFEKEKKKEKNFFPI